MSVSGCFTGADALGLPCNADRDCGLDQRCVEGFCGGPPSTTTESTATTTSDDTSHGPDSSSESGIPGCAVQPGDPSFCMPADPGTDDALCNFDCTAVLCGDGHANAAAGEECEPPTAGQATCECNVVCTLPVCGDGHVNEVAGEDCDEGDDDVEYDDCTTLCRANAFADLLDGPGAWDVETEGLPDGWEHDAIAGQWWSGDYDILDQIADPGRAVPGITRLFSPELAIPARGADPLLLQFAHTYDFDPYCPSRELPEADGGRVELWIDGAAVAWPAADEIYGDTIVDHCGGITDPNPLVDLPAFAGSDPTLAEVAIELPPEAYGETVRIVFAAGFDCGLCDANDEPGGWRIDAVRIGPASAGTCS